MMKLVARREIFCHDLIISVTMIYTLGKQSSTRLSVAALPYCLYAAAFNLIISASAFPTHSIAEASAAPINLIFSASARATSTVFVLSTVGPPQGLVSNNNVHVHK